MTEFAFPAYDRLGPDPEPPGARADCLIRAAVAPRRVSIGHYDGSSALLTAAHPGALLPEPSIKRAKR